MNRELDECITKKYEARNHALHMATSICNTPGARALAWSEANRLSEGLVDLFMELSDNSPAIPLRVDYEGKVYALQSHQKGTSRYVPLIAFEPSRFVYKPLSRKDKYEAETLINAEIMALVENFIEEDYGLPDDEDEDDDGIVWWGRELVFPTE